MTITKKVTFIAKDGCEDKMKELLIAMVAPSKKEDGCIFYDIFQYENNRKKFSAVESWRDEKALDGHKRTSHYAVYKASYEPYCEHKYTDELEILK
ncbi:MAG: antibiotic biosynthesis monooxygenase [Campylobacteraceae bacterium]|nr:antibiotic biosynthesis monooxygenase [Campylobacteraceae bacterium]